MIMVKYSPIMVWETSRTFTWRSARVLVTAAMMPSWSMPVTVRMIFPVIPYGGGMVSGQDSFLGIVTYPG